MSTHGGKDVEISAVIRALNSVGERAEPCGEPVVSGCESDFTPWTVTLISLLSRKSSTHDIILPLMPREIKASKMTMWLALSKALSRSRKAV